MSNLERWFQVNNFSRSHDFSQLEDSLDRLINEMIAAKKGRMSSFNFEPSCEVLDEGKNYLLKFDLPGVTKDQVKVQVDKDQLTVFAERKEEQKHETKRKFLSEVHYGSYSRSFTLPGPVDEKKVDAKFENGVLTITIPKTETLQSKQIPVQ